MAEIREYIKENLSLSFTSWSQGQKVGTLIGLVGAAAIGLVGAGSVPSDAMRYWSLALVFAFVALVLVITPVRMWFLERAKVENAEAKLRPRVRCSFDRKQDCQHRTKYKGTSAETGERVTIARVRLFRVRVETDVPGGLKECRASLLWLKRDNRTLFEHGPLPLVIAPAERQDPFSKDLRDKVAEYVDLFCLTDDNKVKLVPLLRPLPISIGPGSLFTGPGEYRFHVVVSAQDSASCPIDVVLKWTGDSETAEAYVG